MFGTSTCPAEDLGLIPGQSQAGVAKRERETHTSHPHVLITLSGRAMQTQAAWRFTVFRRGLWDLTSPTRDRTQALVVESPRPDH